MLLRPYRNRSLVFATVGFFVVGALFVAAQDSLFRNEYQGSADRNTHIIELHKDGFVPRELTIVKGDTVIFSTSRSAPFWPASNLHPTHTIYLEFDPKRALDPGETWSFTFQKEGTWKYHDHLAPLYRGVIIVLGGAGQQASHILQSETPCENGGGEFACWEYRVDRALKEDGLDGAFEAVAALSSAYPSFAKNCHEFGHKIGEAAYFEFSKTRDIALTSKTSYCGYGFYHGFMEALLQTTGDMKEAREFCANAARDLTAETPDAEGECYHGIGHGAVDGSDPESFSNAQAMITVALETCESVSITASHLHNCFSGVFNALANFAVSGERDVGFAAEHPFVFCSGQRADIAKEACYSLMVRVVYEDAGRNFSEAAAAVESVIASEYRSAAASSLAVIRALEGGRSDPALAIAGCRVFHGGLFLSCIQGYVKGLLLVGEPEKEYEIGSAFCRSAILSFLEQKSCFEMLVRELGVLYSSVKMRDICAIIQEYPGAREACSAL